MQQFRASKKIIMLEKSETMNNSGTMPHRHHKLYTYEILLLAINNNLLVFKKKKLLIDIKLKNNILRMIITNTTNR